MPKLLANCEIYSQSLMVFKYFCEKKGKIDSFRVLLTQIKTFF